MHPDGLPKLQLGLESNEPLSAVTECDVELASCTHFTVSPTITLTVAGENEKPDTLTVFVVAADTEPGATATARVLTPANRTSMRGRTRVRARLCMTMATHASASEFSC